MHTTLLRTAAAALALTSASFVVQAGDVPLPMAGVDVTLTGWSFGTGNTVQASGLPAGSQAGGFMGSLGNAGVFDAASFHTYCIETSEFFSFGTAPMTGYTLVDGGSYFAARRGDAGIAQRLGRLLTYVADHPSAVDTAAESTALQLAVWNMVYDIDDTVSAVSMFRDVSGFKVQADALLAGAKSVATSRFAVYALEKAGSQDFLLVGAQAVPEPGSLALAGLAVVALGATRRTRRIV